MLRQIGRLNGILPEDVHPEAALKQAARRRRKSLSPRKRRTKMTKTKLRVASTGKEGAEGALSAQNQEHAGGPPTRKLLRQQSATTSLDKPAPPPLPPPPLHPSDPKKNGLDHIIQATPVHHSVSHHRLSREEVASNESGTTRFIDKVDGTPQDDRAGCVFQKSRSTVARERDSDPGPVRPHTRPRSIAEVDISRSARSIGRRTPGKLSPIGGGVGGGGRTRSAVGLRPENV